MRKDDVMGLQQIEALLIAKQMIKETSFLNYSINKHIIPV